MLGEQLSKEQCAVAEEIYAESNNKILIKESISYEELKEYSQKENAIFVFDLSPEKSRIRELLYKKAGIEYSCIEVEKDIEKVKKWILDRVKLYHSKAILGTKCFVDFVLECDQTVLCLNKEDLMWSKEFECYEYVGDIKEEIECVFMFWSLSINPCIKIREKFVPVMNLDMAKYQQQCGKNEFELKEWNASDYDIATNIIPFFKSKDVQCLVFGNPDQEYIKKYGKFEFKGTKETIAKAGELLLDSNEDEQGSKIWEELGSNVFIKTKGIVRFADKQGQYCNFYNGERYTVGNPRKYDNTVFLFGPCLVRGDYVEDKYTLGSFLASKLNKRFYVKNLGNSWDTMSLEIRSHKFHKGDILIVFCYSSEIYQKMGIKVHSLLEAYEKIPNVENCVWDLLVHCDKKVTKEIANVVYNVCSKNNVFEPNVGNVEEDNTIQFFCDTKEKSELLIPSELQSWLESVKKYKKENTKCAGAIVMNCNPFTLGHRYLIEYARKQVDVLYIFVVEENKSFFSFEDRLCMVKLGVIDLENVVVIPSGHYIISTATLPGYFEKENNPEVAFDATGDLEIFARVIAKQFGIVKRFAGEEPVDAFTRRYNQQMEEILPKYGIEFCEIQRKCIGEEIISATTVRKYMKEKNVKEIQKLVLPEVYNYIKEYYM